MAPPELPTVSKPSKLPRLPKTQKIQKRPLLHPPIAAPRTGSTTPKTIYVSTNTPFIATIKRVQKLLGYIEQRSCPQLKGAGNERQILQAIEEGVRRRREGDGEEVVMKGTGKAVEMVMRLGVWWGGREDVQVRVGTGSVGAVDDVVEGGEVEGSRVRRVSCLEVGVRLK